MITQSKALKEIHDIMEKIYENQKGMGPKEIVRDFNESAKRFVKEHNIKIKHPEKKPVIKYKDYAKTLS